MSISFHNNNIIIINSISIPYGAYLVELVENTLQETMTEREKAAPRRPKRVRESGESVLPKKRSKVRFLA